MSVSKLVVPVATTAALLLAGCSDPDAPDGSGQTSESFEFGRPANSRDADRRIQIDATDDFNFDPTTLDVTSGEIITFTVNNLGELPHEFTLGPKNVQMEHGEEMTEMDDMDMADEPNTISLAAGDTNSLTWEFTESGPLLYGCHTPGHYEAGMVGELVVASA